MMQFSKSFIHVLIFILACLAPEKSLATLENWKDRVIYQILTDRFYDGNTANDLTGPCWSGTAGGNLAMYIGGDWAGVTAKLPTYIVGLTANASLWLSPFDQQVTVPTSGNCAYHGYWRAYLSPLANNPTYTTCPTTYETYFGTSTEFTTMLASIKSHSMQIIQDQVANHCGYGCPWYNAVNSDFIIDATGGCALPGSCSCSASTCWDCSLVGLPDIIQEASAGSNYANAVKYDVACWDAWIKQYNTAYGSIWGVRFDAIEEQVPSVFTSTSTTSGLIAAQVAVQSNLFTFGEYDNGGCTTCAGAQYMKGANAQGLTSLLNFAVYGGSSNLYTAGASSANWLSQVTAVYNTYSVAPYITSPYPDQALLMVNFLDSQDQDRLFTNLNGRYGSCCGANYLANAYMMIGSLHTIPGIPVTLYGTEIGMVGAQSTQANRNYMPSWAFNSGFSGFAVNSGWYAPDSLSAAVQISTTVKSAIAMRNKFQSLRRGLYYPLWSQCTSGCPYGATSDIAAWLRSDQVDQPIISVMNNGDLASGHMLIPINSNASQTVSLKAVDLAKLTDCTVLDDVFVQSANTGQSSLTISGGYLRPLQPYGKTLSVFRPRPATGNLAVTITVTGVTTSFGQGVYLSGSIAELNMDVVGSVWATWNAIRMTYISGSTWSATIRYLKPNTVFSFTTVLQPYQPATTDYPCDSASTSSGWYVAWEVNPNYSCTVASSGSSYSCASVAHHGWQSPIAVNQC